MSCSLNGCLPLGNTVLNCPAVKVPNTCITPKLPIIPSLYKTQISVNVSSSTESGSVP
jgi:hypothetical protein